MMLKRVWSPLAAVIVLLSGCQNDGKPLIPVTPVGNDATPATRPATTQSSGYADICVKAQTARVPVLMFHDIIPKRNASSVFFDCSVREFRQILDWIDANKLQPISLDQLYGHLTQGDDIPPGAIVLTFDDNYQGFYDNAYPLLKAKHFPCAMFVHTNYVGSQAGRPKMTWETLKSLVSDGLVTIGSHTLSHPDLTTLTDDEQQREIADAKKVLEDHLGIKVDYFAYPDGKNNATSQMLVHQAGYKMAFTVDNGPAEESPNIVTVNRYIQTRYQQALQDCQDAMDNAPVAIVSQTIDPAPITYETGVHAGNKMTFIRGGTPETVRSASREGVQDFVADAQAQAGINGTFFALAEVAGTSNEMVGPVFTSNEKVWVPDDKPDRLLKIVNRPMVLFGPGKIAYIPFVPAFNAEAALRDFMPDFTDAFVGGVWLVHAGVARTEDQMLSFGASDAMQPRRRCFFGTTATGQIVLGASNDSVTSVELARAAVDAGVSEAVMMDCGFSTALVYGNKVVASGHSTPTAPSRPVPHAIVLTGQLAMDPNTIAIPQPKPEVSHRRRRRRRSSDASAPTPDTSTVAPSPPAPDGGDSAPPE
jgi:peptidoglycan/xylan/chitin deacetylase (PgdA/CDA1 family)